ncbi:UV excision repair protein (RadW) [Penicillium chermesinum]|uniref:UV excision repair protein RAD23 n=1 Tax=Penicillium chermesinum TaxID=63820 RepID=A0A9W9TP91_9EURO|nr:UV excision repair protein (RadW) [Penicillium chermesinum]KAJ5232029.1 UV excision repair protein (RadW) [Penicillium chermesinum]
MKLTFKDLKQEKFVIEVEPSETVRQVKEKIAQVKGGYEAERTKILQDDKTVESYNIQEKDFLVCLPSKQPKTASSSTPQAPSTPAARAPASTPAAPPPRPLLLALLQLPRSLLRLHLPTNPSQAPAFNDPSALAMGSAAESAVTQMEAMGFARSDIDRAMRAAFFNPDRAIEYLLTGIPDNVQQEQQQNQQAQQAERATGETPAAATTPAAGGNAAEEPLNLFEAAAQATEGGGGRGSRGGAGAGAGGGDALGSLDFLRSNPHSSSYASLCNNSLKCSSPFCNKSQLGTPRLRRSLARTPTLLSEDLEEDEAPLPPGTQAIQVTEEERDAIERLCRLGFPRDSVIQAYFACDKNEELAANFLFDQPDEDEE